MNNLLQKLMLGGSTVALVTATSAISAFAQGNGANDIEQVVVSASRISIAGYQAPTPVTVVGAAQLAAEAYVDLGDSIRQLPALGASYSPGNGGGSTSASQGYLGIDNVNLRNLGVNRSLVLFDGQRVVNSDPFGNDVDLGTIPNAVVQRIDVVTGGASAAWGSDAVSGVVNLVIDKTFTGFKANIEGGQNSASDHQQSKIDATWGRDFLDGRLHVEVSGTYIMAPDTIYMTKTHWYKAVTLFPGTTTTWRHTTGLIGNSNFINGGVISSGPLKGIQFANPTGTPGPFYFGTAYQGLCENCSAGPLTGVQPSYQASIPYHTTTFFGYSSYKITNDLLASVMLNYGKFVTNDLNQDKQAVATILSGNPYIPASVQAQMTALAVPSIPVGTINRGGCDYRNPTFIQSAGCEIANGSSNLQRALMRGVFTLSGSLGADWSWEAYAQHGVVREQEYAEGNAVATNYLNAIDAVTVTAAQAAASGGRLAPGSIACRTTLTQNNGCQPLNVFGTAEPPLATLNYVDPGRINPAIGDKGYMIMQLEVFAASAQGTTPWGLDAGKIAVAFGAEYHHVMQRNTTDPLRLGTVGGWNNGNLPAFAGQYSVEEGFGEVDIPVLKDTFIQSLDVSAAGRITNYSTSGMVETWKLGATAQIDDNIKLRTTWSTDIRAPSITELFATGNFQHGPTTDLKAGKAVIAFTVAAGNPNLTPEVASTISGGIVLTPQFIPGLSASIDYYSISIKKAIFLANALQEQQQCLLGVALYCTLLVYGDPQYLPDYPGALDYIYQSPLNATSQTTSGVDFQVDYSHDLFAGSLNWHLVGNYTNDFSQTALGLRFQGAGAMSSAAQFQGPIKLHTNLSATYTQGPWQGSVGVRYLGPAKINPYWKNGVDIDNNGIPQVGYLDLRGSYRWNDNVQFYGTVTNFTNAPPPNTPSNTGAYTTNLLVYDGIGRMYQAGVRFNLD